MCVDVGMVNGTMLFKYNRTKSMPSMASLYLMQTYQFCDLQRLVLYLIRAHQYGTVIFRLFVQNLQIWKTSALFITKICADRVEVQILPIQWNPPNVDTIRIGTAHVCLEYAGICISWLLVKLQ